VTTVIAAESSLVATSPTDSTSRRGPGRPRDQDLDQLIVGATLELIDAGDEVTVSRVVDRSGVSRAALYRRWPSLTSLIAAALDVGRVVPPELPDDVELRSALFASMLQGADSAALAGYTDERFRQRIRLVMADRALQRAYWTSHVARRRAPIEDALRRGVEQGRLRADLDVAACFDAMAGTAYYQVVVRGERLGDAATNARLEAALEVIWRGMLA